MQPITLPDGMEVYPMVAPPTMYESLVDSGIDRKLLYSNDSRFGSDGLARKLWLALAHPPKGYPTRMRLTWAEYRERYS